MKRPTNNIYLFITVSLIFLNQSGLGQELYQMQEHLHTKWASPENPAAEKGKGGMADFGRKGRYAVRLEPGDTLVLAEECSGTTGTIRRIWMTLGDRTIDQLMGLTLNFYWDQACRPAVSAPVGCFFGMMLGDMIRYESALFTSPEGRSFNCYIPMPFRDGMKLLLINETDQPQPTVFYDIDYTVGDKHNGNVLYFHTFYRRTDSTEMRRDYEFLPFLEGSGKFLGVHFGVIANQEFWFNSWWGEGEVKFYLDGDIAHPSLCGTGTEDYIGTGWGQGLFDNMFQGNHYTDTECMKYCFYRFHIPDPVYFHSDIRGTIQQIGCCFDDFKHKFKENQIAVYETGNSNEPTDYEHFKSGLFERYGDDWSSCAYFYLDKPYNDLPDIPDYQHRVKRLKEILIQKKLRELKMNKK